MTRTTRSTKRPEPNVFRSIYRFFYSKIVGVVIILAVAIVSLAGTLIPQAPAAARHDPAIYRSFLDQARESYGAWTPILDFLGFFRLWTSPLFLTLIAMLALSIIACTVHRLPELSTRVFQPRLHVTPRFFVNAQYRATIPVDVDTKQALTYVKDTLNGSHFRVLDDPQAPGEQIYADKWRFGPFGTVVAHTSFIVIILAFVVSAFAGYDQTLEVPISETVDVGAGTQMQLTAESFSDVYDTQGRPLDYVSVLRVSRDGKTLARQEVRVNTPLVVDGVRFHQASFGIAASVTIKDKSGDVLFDGVLPLTSTTSDGLHSAGSVDLNKVGVGFDVITPASGQMSPEIEPGSAVIQMYRLVDGNSLGQIKLDQGQSGDLNDFTVSFNREQQYTGIMVRKDPGAWFMWIGSALLIIGTVMTFVFRHRRLWIRVSDSPEEESSRTIIQVASVEKLDTAFERQFRQLVNKIDSAIPADHQPAQQIESK